MRLAVLGGSSGAFATAADMALARHQVRLWRRSEADLPPLRDGITLVAEERGGKATLDLVTADLEAALDGAEVVIAPLPATAHEDLAKRLTGHLRDWQVVLLAPGTLGAYAIAREIARAGGTLPYAFAETGTLPYLCRKTGPAAVAAPVRAASLSVGVFPASRGPAVLARVAELFPSTRPCTDALDAALTNAGVVIHPPLVLLNASAIDGGRLDLQASSPSASARTLIDAANAERLATRRGWGYTAPHHELATFHDEARAAAGLGGEILTFEHRWVTEDIVFGLSLFESAARTAGVPSPAISGLLGVFGVLLGRELSGRGRALEALGLGDFALREIRALLHEGWASPFWTKVLR